MNYYNVVIFMIVAALFSSIQISNQLEKNTYKKLIMPNKPMRNISLFMAVGFIFLLCVFLFEPMDDKWIMYVFLGVLFPFVFIFYFYSMNIRIDLGENGFLYRSFWRRKYHFRYDQAIKMKEVEAGMKIYFPGARIDISYMVMTNTSEFINRVKKANPDIEITHYWDNDKKIQKYIKENKLHSKQKKDLSERIYEHITKY